MTAKVLMVQGTSSSAGKSTLVTALCRVLAQDGFRVAPFKAQNMSLNSFVTPEGHEIGRSQAVQAEAAGIAPHVDMNPVLLKPEGGGRCQTVLMGRAWDTSEAGDYGQRKAILWSKVTEALSRLRAQNDVVLIEGAGSPAEINLRDSDIVNMAVALHAECPVLLVGDIDRGGVFASLVGTLVLLSEPERELVKGLIINRFRGDLDLLRPGLTMLEERAQVPVLGVIPFMRELRIAEEDAVALDDPHAAAQEGASVDIAVVRFPGISNFDDMDSLALEPSVAVRFVQSPREMGHPDAVVLPGTKRTLADLSWLREVGLDHSVLALARAGVPVVGICGGFQMLGESVSDPLGSEAAAGSWQEGLGLLSVTTEFATIKETCQVEARVLAGPGRGNDVQGYEIHMGSSRRVEESTRPLLRVNRRAGLPTSDDAGAVDRSGRIWGTYVHGIFDQSGFRRAWLQSLGWSAGPQTIELPTVRQSEYDRLASVTRESVDMSKIRAIAGIDS